MPRDLSAQAGAVEAHRCPWMAGADVALAFPNKDCVGGLMSLVTSLLYRSKQHHYYSSYSQQEKYSLVLKPPLLRTHHTI